MTPLKRKIEDRSISAIQNVIDKHPTMEGYINKRDKELSWDGYIRLYQQDDVTSDKANYDDDVPVQIKGHVGVLGAHGTVIGKIGIPTP